MTGRGRTWAGGLMTISVLMAIWMTGWPLASNSARATERVVTPVKASCEVEIVLGPSFIQKMFKAGVFIYGSSSVGVAMGGNQSLSASFPLEGTSNAAPTSLIQVDGETGGMDFFNGPAGATASLNAPVVSRTGSTGFITGTFVGPFSIETGQFAETMPVFAMSSARAKASGTGWTMTAALTLTEQGAATLNTLLKTNFFQAAARIGSLNADVLPTS